MLSEDLEMKAHHKIDYVEFPSADLEKTKAFFSKAFGWQFEDFGSEYIRVLVMKGFMASSIKPIVPASLPTVPHSLCYSVKISRQASAR